MAQLSTHVINFNHSVENFVQQHYADAYIYFLMGTLVSRCLNQKKHLLSNVRYSFELDFLLVTDKWSHFTRSCHFFLMSGDKLTENLCILVRPSKTKISFYFCTRNSKPRVLLFNRFIIVWYVCSAQTAHEFLKSNISQTKRVKSVKYDKFIV